MDAHMLEEFKLMCTNYKQDEICKGCMKQHESNTMQKRQDKQPPFPLPCLSKTPFVQYFEQQINTKLTTQTAQS